MIPLPRSLASRRLRRPTFVATVALAATALAATVLGAGSSPAGAAAQATCTPGPLGGFAADQQVTDVATSADGTHNLIAVFDTTTSKHRVLLLEPNGANVVLGPHESKPEIAISADGGTMFVTSRANPLGTNPDGNRELFAYPYSAGTEL
ncbi:hypothetical protein B7486_57835 [cyanobacterium TDX16]|nr:hypothetical protein B7486_57835 [cyanobacterium TDX16]